MCGRYTQTASGDEVAEAFALGEREALAPRYNICPTQKAAVVRVDPDTGRRGLVHLTWGLVPRTALGKERGHINARAESAWERPTFAEAFAERRCLVPATGFYEWQKLDDGKRRPWLLRLAASGPFAFAGLFTGPRDRQAEDGTCAIVTTVPNALVAPVHNRMPVILAPEDEALWLDPDARDPVAALSCLRPYPAELMAVDPADPRVGSPLNDDPGLLLAPVAA